MASVSLDPDKINKGKSNWAQSNKVYARRFKKGAKINQNQRSAFVRVKIDLKSVTSTNDLSNKLKLELDQVRDLVQKLEDKKRRVKAFKSCNNLLQRLMKHKHGWVFNDPVDVEKLGLHDYHEIIKHPMDLGTIKGRLAQNFYKFPKEFEEDVRVTFCNALTYNCKGHEVHGMAEQMLNMFEKKWAVIESECNPGCNGV